MSTHVKTVREIALETPASTRIFERFGIDYCCGGRKPLSEACADLQLSVDEVLQKLEQAGLTPDEEHAPDWQDLPLNIRQTVLPRHFACEDADQCVCPAR